MNTKMRLLLASAFIVSGPLMGKFSDKQLDELKVSLAILPKPVREQLAVKALLQDLKDCGYEEIDYLSTDSWYHAKFVGNLYELCQDLPEPFTEQLLSSLRIDPKTIIFDDGQRAEQNKSAVVRGYLLRSALDKFEKADKSCASCDIVKNFLQTKLKELKEFEESARQKVDSLLSEKN